MNLAAARLAMLAPLLAELGDLKRTYHAGAPESLAATSFRRAWQLLCAQEDPETVALSTVAGALTACRLGAIDAALLERCGVDGAARRSILERAFEDVATPLDPALTHALRAHIASAGVVPNVDTVEAPALPFVDALARQPRAGATSPGKPRLVLEPPESHADHCFAVAVYAVLVAPRYAAAPADAFLLGMTHHLHNAVLPDAGFTGETLLGDALAPMVERITESILRSLPAKLAARIRTLRPLLAAADAPAAAAFHAADVIDRVLQVGQYARVAAFQIDQALDDLELVHAGPVQAFHLETLAEAGLP